MRIAFVIPVDATRHAEYALRLSQLVSHVSDVYIILSRESDRELWEQATHTRDMMQVIVLSRWIPEVAIRTAEANRAMPTFKKWMGLHLVIQNHEALSRYSHLICCDSEIRVLRAFDANFVASLPSQFTIVGDHISRSAWHDNFGARILADVKSRLADVPMTEAASKIACLDKAYSWWCGLPIYSCDNSLLDFLRQVKTHDSLKLASSLTCASFDHLIYQRYLLLRSLCNARLACLTHDLGISMGWSLECFATPAILEATEKAGLQTLWVSKVTRLKYPQIAPTAYIEYHLDRNADLE